LQFSILFSVGLTELEPATLAPNHRRNTQHWATNYLVLPPVSFGLHRDALGGTAVARVAAPSSQPQAIGVRARRPRLSTPEHACGKRDKRYWCERRGCC